VIYNLFFKNKGKTIFVFALLFLFLGMNLVSSQPPTSTIISDRGVDIVHPETQVVPSDEDIEFNFWTYNSTSGATFTNSSLNCTLYILDNKGVQYYRFSNQAGANGLMTYGKGAPLCVNCWTMTLPKENLSVGIYSYQIKCQGGAGIDAIGGYYTGFFEVTPTGNQSNTTIFLFLLISSCVLLYFSYLFKNYIFATLSGFLFIITGIYSMIYGFADITNLYTQMISLIILGVGMIITVTASLELSGGSKERF
jgi:hypothetical protein